MQKEKEIEVLLLYLVKKSDWTGENPYQLDGLRHGR